MFLFVQVARLRRVLDEDRKKLSALSSASTSASTQLSLAPEDDRARAYLVEFVAEGKYRCLLCRKLFRAADFVGGALFLWPRAGPGAGRQPTPKKSRSRLYRSRFLQPFSL